MTLEEELIKEGFEKVSGTFTTHNIGDALGSLFNKSPRPVYIKIIQEKMARDGIDNPDSYIIYYMDEEDLRNSPSAFFEYCPYEINTPRQ